MIPSISLRRYDRIYHDIIEEIGKQDPSLIDDLIGNDTNRQNDIILDKATDLFIEKINRNDKMIQIIGILMRTIAKCP